MWKMKNLYKKTGAFFLAATLILSAGSPISVSAEDKTVSNETIVQNVPTGTEEETDKNKNVKTTEQDGYDDVTKPVIEQVIFEQKDKTLNLGDDVKLVVQTYDTDSEVQEVKANIILTTSENTNPSSPQPMSFVKTQKENQYEGSFTLPKNISYTEGIIKDIQVMDNRGNSTTYDETFHFKIAGIEVKPSSISDFQFNGNGQIFKADESIQLSYSLANNEENEELYQSGMTVTFTSDSDTTFHCVAIYNPTTQKFEVNQPLKNYMGDSKWTLFSISDTWYGPVRKYDLSSIGECWFQVETVVSENPTPNQDKEAPQITSVDISHNKQVVEPGTTITIKIKATDNVALDPYNAKITYYAVESNITNSAQYIFMDYDETSQTFIGTFEITEDTYPCEWYLGNISLYDKAGNSANTDEIIYDENLVPINYILVKNGNTFVNPTINVELTFAYLLKDGSMFPDNSLSISADIERRSTLKESGIQLPTPSVMYKDLQFIGWVDANGKAFTEDTEIISNGSIYLYAKYNKLPVRVAYDYLGEDGKLISETKTELLPSDATYGQLLEIVSKHEVPKENSYGVHFEKWVPYYPEEDLNSPITPNQSLYFQAYYDKCIVVSNYSYMNELNEWVTLEKYSAIDRNTTSQQLIKEVKEFQPSDANSNLKFKEWEQTQFSPSHEKRGFIFLNFDALYDGDKVVTSIKRYHDESGRFRTLRDTFVVKEGTTYGEAIEKELEKPVNIHKDLGFKGWDYEFKEECDDSEPIKENHTEVYLTPQYENSIVTYYVYDNWDDWQNGLGQEWMYEITGEKAFAYQIVKPNTEITLPTQIGPYNHLKSSYWSESPGSKFVVSGPIFNFIFLDTETVVTPDQPVIPDTPTEPEVPEDKPVVELPEDFIAAQVDKLNKGESVHIGMGEATIVPKEILEAAKGKDVIVKLNMGNYIWTINGKDIKANILKDINLEVKVDANAIPSKVVKALAGKNPTCQLSLTHNGPFGFKADLTVNVGTDYNGKYGNLYYYDSDGKMVYRNSGLIDKDGNVTLSFDHASDYVIVINEQMMSQTDVPASLNPNNGSVATGDTAPIFALTLLAIVSAGTIMVILLKRKTNRTKL